jgi:hypothetical protein
MPINIQDNLIHPKERHVRTELWKQKIYHIPFNPYRFPKNDGSGDFIPLPKRFSEIIGEFRKHIDEQKAQEITEEEKETARQRIKEIEQELKEWVETIIATYGLKPTAKEQEQIKAFQLALKFSTLNQWQRFIQKLSETLEKQEEEIITDPGAGDILKLPSVQSIPVGEEGEPEPKIFDEEAEQQIIKEILTILEAWKGKAIEANLPYINEAIVALSKNVGTKKEQWNLVSDLTLYTSDYPAELTDYLQQWELLYNPSEEDEEKPQTEQLEVREKIAPKAIISLVKEIEEQRKIARDRKNSCFIEEDNADSLVFCYQPPKGDFHALDDFLWYRNNIWYETIKGSWRRINHENAIIAVKRSFFVHNYHKFFPWWSKWSIS